MLQLKNETPFTAKLFLLPDAAGIETVFTVVKATFALTPQLRLAEEQVPVAPVDAHHGDPALTSVRVPSDVSLSKQGTDVLVLGSAWAPGGKPTWQSDVSVRVGPVAKTARIFGDRVWDAGPTGAAVSWVAPFDRMPLVWERAFGGTDLTEQGPIADWRNPVGKGFRASGSLNALAGAALPNIEDPAALISSPRDTRAPTGFGPIAAHWEPRRSFAGTYDESWQRTRAPYLPHDFDARFLQLAPPGLVVAGHLRGGELVDIRGATPDGVLQCALPGFQLGVTYRLDEGSRQRAAVLDTVIIETDVQRLVMVWRTALPCDKKALKVREVTAQVLRAA
jgi:hypothetical protein